MCAGKRPTLQATIMTIFSRMIRDVSVFVKCGTIFRCFFWKLPQIRTSNFRKVVRQHTEGMVRSIIWVMLKIYFSFQQCKNFENPLKIYKFIAVLYFLGTQCRIILYRVMKIPTLVASTGLPLLFVCIVCCVVREIVATLSSCANNESCSQFLNSVRRQATL